MDRRSFTAPASTPTALAARRLAATVAKFATLAECATATEFAAVARRAARLAAARVTAGLFFVAQWRFRVRLV